MTKAVSLICLAIFGVFVLMAATRAISRLASALTPLILVIGVLVLAWQIVRYMTRQ
jgi:hypothetical protein